MSDSVIAGAASAIQQILPSGCELYRTADTRFAALDVKWHEVTALPFARLRVKAKREIIRMNERLNRIFAAATGQPVEKIAKDTDRDLWLSAEEAKDYGLVSRIINSQADI